MAAEELLEHGRPTRAEIVDLLSGHLCRCTGYEPDRGRDPGRLSASSTAIAGSRRREPRAVSLLAACERHPELEAFPGAHVRRAAATDAADRRRARRRARASASRSCWTTGSRRRSSTGPRSGPARRRAALVAARPRRSSPTAWPTAARGIVIREGDALPDGPEHPGALDRAERRDLADALHVGHDRQAEGRAALAPRRPRGRLVAGAPARLPVGRPHARRDAALPHDGHPLARRDAPRRRLLRAAAALGRGRGAAADRGAAASPRCTSRPPCFTTSSTIPSSARATSRPCVRSGTQERR